MRRERQLGLGLNKSCANLQTEVCATARSPAGVKEDKLKFGFLILAIFRISFNFKNHFASQISSKTKCYDFFC